MVTRTYKFRPQGMSTRYKMRERRIGFPSNLHWFNWQARASYFDNEVLNKRTLGKIFGRLHHLSSHAPEAAAKRWRNAEHLFYSKHFGNGKQSTRYSNTYTCHSWM